MSDEGEASTAFSEEVGRRLRAVRKARRLSLDDVERASGGRWSASAIGAYERGFRNLTLPRLRELAGFYGVPMSTMLGDSTTAPEPDGARPPKLVLDLTALQREDEARPVLRYLRSIIVERGDFNGRVLSIRRDDVRALCAVLQAGEEELYERLRRWDALLAGT